MCRRVVYGAKNILRGLRRANDHARPQTLPVFQGAYAPPHMQLR